MTSTSCTAASVDHPPTRPPGTLWLGLAMLGLLEALLMADVARRGGLVVPRDALVSELPDPVGWLGVAGRWTAANMTPLCWIAYLLVFDGLLTWLARRRDDPGLSPIRSRPNRFVVAWLTSIPVWCFFDWLNFYYMDAWRYHGLPPTFAHRAAGYFVAFAAISPGMFLAAHLYQHLGFDRLRLESGSTARRAAWAVLLTTVAALTAIVLLTLAFSPTTHPADFDLATTAAVLLGPGIVALLAWRSLPAASAGFGVGFMAWAVWAHDPLANLTLWVGLILLLDPINLWLGRPGTPSLLRDWQAGRWGRTLALFAGGATCGLLWEFWNYWAIAKWTYHLPFLGELARYRYFEMPLLGFFGFLPFAAECWVVLNTIIVGFERLGLRLAEPLPDERAVM